MDTLFTSPALIPTCIRKCDIFRGQFAPVIDLEALDISALGRDITGLFAVIVDHLARSCDHILWTFIADNSIEYFEPDS